MNKEAFIEDYKNIKKQDIIEELYYKCKANRDYYVEIERLNNIINKAIEYIETGKTFPSDETRETVEYMQNILLDILKGSDKE